MRSLALALFFLSAGAPVLAAEDDASRKCHREHADPLQGRATTAAKRPNIIFILADDQDYEMDSLAYMPLVKKHMSEKGTRFDRHYVTTAQCCPSRSTLWTGKATHNTNVTDVTAPHGAWQKFVKRGLNDNYLPIWMSNHGYNTYYTGKFQNGQGVKSYGKGDANPLMKGWTSADVLLEPNMYNYYNPVMKRDKQDHTTYKNHYSTDPIRDKGIDYLDEASKAGKPFFLGIAPVGPHVRVDHMSALPDGEHTAHPAKRHENMFPHVTVPPDANFNPDKPSGGGWVKGLKQLSKENVTFVNLAYRRRLQTLQAVDELVEAVVKRVEALGIDDHTYIFYSSDNGYHAGQHRLGPGKGCPYETDVHVPMIVRGPGIKAGVHQTDLPTSHVDVAPTLLTLAGIPLRDDFDGTPMPLGTGGITRVKQEHVAIEFWGSGKSEGMGPKHYANNTYKELRMIGGSGAGAFNLAYMVWCDGDRELYDMTADKFQMHNLLPPSGSHSIRIGDGKFGVKMVRDRLDALVQVLKKCDKGICRKPWHTLHPQGDVTTLRQAMNIAFDDFYANQPKMKYDECFQYYNAKAEGGPAKPFGGRARARGLSKWQNDHVWSGSA